MSVASALSLMNEAHDIAALSWYVRGRVLEVVWTFVRTPARVSRFPLAIRTVCYTIDTTDQSVEL